MSLHCMHLRREFPDACKACVVADFLSRPLSPENYAPNFFSLTKVSREVHFSANSINEVAFDLMKNLVAIGVAIGCQLFSPDRQ